MQWTGRFSGIYCNFTIIVILQRVFIKKPSDSYCLFFISRAESIGSLKFLCLPPRIPPKKEILSDWEIKKGNYETPDFWNKTLYIFRHVSVIQPYLFWWNWLEPSCFLGEMEGVRLKTLIWCLEWCKRDQEPNTHKSSSPNKL